MKTYSVRFLKSGSIEFEASNHTTLEELRTIAKDILNTTSDQDLCMAMSDCTPCGRNPSRFEVDSFQVEALEDRESDYEYIYMTPLWKEYAGYNNG